MQNIFAGIACNWFPHPMGVIKGKLAHLGSANESVRAGAVVEFMGGGYGKVLFQKLLKHVVWENDPDLAVRLYGPEKPPTLQPPKTRSDKEEMPDEVDGDNNDGGKELNQSGWVQPTDNAGRNAGKCMGFEFIDIL